MTLVLAENLDQIDQTNPGEFHDKLHEIKCFEREIMKQSSILSFDED